MSEKDVIVIELDSWDKLSDVALTILKEFGGK
jgi:hypothetical protein